MLDINTAKDCFMNYVQQFDLTNDKIHLKLIHTLEVVHTTEYLCLQEGASKEASFFSALKEEELAFVIRL